MDQNRTLRIGSTELANNLILGPMAGVTDLVFRRLCGEQGCGASYTEMVSAKALFFHEDRLERFIRESAAYRTGPGTAYRGADKSMGLMRVAGDEGPVALQLFGSDPEIISRVAAIAEEGPYAWIDINMGCPMPKIVNNGDGAALMKDIRKAEAVLKALVRGVKKPVTVKLRKAYSDGDLDAVEFARMAESCGAAAVAVHGRTRDQLYRGRAPPDPLSASVRGAGSFHRSPLSRAAQVPYRSQDNAGSLGRSTDFPSPRGRSSARRSPSPKASSERPAP